MKRISTGSVMTAIPSQLERLRELLAINRIITSSLDYDEVLRRVVEKTLEFTGAAACLLLLGDGGREARVAASAGIAEDLALRFSAPLDEHIGVALREFLGFGAHYGFTGVPVMDSGSLRGILALYRREPLTADADEAVLLSALADQAAIALRHAREHRTLRRDLRVREALTERIFHHAPLGFLVLDADLSIRELNATAARLIGRARLECVGRPLAEVCAVKAAVIVPLCRRALAGEPEETAEMRCEHQGPVPAPETFLQVRCAGLPDETGRIEAVLAMLADVTGEKQSERELHATHLRLQALMEALPVGVSFSEDATCQAITGNATARAQFEADLEDNLSASADDPNRLGRRVRYFKDGREVPAQDLPLQRAVAEHRAIPPMELEVELPSGRRWIAEASAAPLRTPNGRIAGGVAVTLDITERKRVEEALRQSEEKFRTLFESMDEAFCVIEIIFDEEGKPVDFRYVETNPAFERHATRPMLGKRIKEIVPDLEPFWLNHYGHVALTGESVRLENVVKGLGDQWFLAYGFRVGGKDSRQVAVLFTNITERKRAEEALREADRRKDEFLAMLGHELRNPLAPIQNAAHLLRRPELSAPQIGWCRTVIERQVEQLSRLVDDLLDVSRISRGKIELQKEPLALADIVQRAVETSRPLLDARRHEFSVRLPPEPLRVEGDLVRLAQLISNLLNNAAKYTDEGGQIRLGVERDGGFALIRVRDTGRGVDPAVLPRIFDLFYQADRTLDRAEGGLGIGLSLVKRLVDMHGGTVQAFSAGLGQGTEFTVRLPLLPELPEADGGLAAAGPGSRKFRRLLVVDDNQDAAESLALLLGGEGHEVLTAYDGRRAVELALSERPEAVLLDIGLPELDGYEACRRMRAGGLTDTLIVAMTGYGQDEDRRRSREAGFDAHLVKPADLADIQAVLAGRGSRA